MMASTGGPSSDAYTEHRATQCAILGVEMFERFTDRSRRVLVLAQEEARLLDHNFMGTEHILLGLLHEEQGIAAQALGQLGVHLDNARQQVELTVGRGDVPSNGSPPFTPRAKKVLELSLREALQLKHSHIGTEHILLGLVREGEGVGARVLADMGADPSNVRQQVLNLLADSPSVPGQMDPVSLGTTAWLIAPRCHRCSSDLVDTVRYRVMEVLPDEALSLGGPVQAILLYCSRCGTVLGAIRPDQGT